VINLEDKVLSAVLTDRQVHILLQANVDEVLRTHKDVWGFIKTYYENNQSTPPVALVESKFPDFEYTSEVGATKYHLDELRQDYLEDNFKIALRSAATSIQEGRTAEALDLLIKDTSALKKITADVRDLDIADVDDAVAYFEKVRELMESGFHGIRTGLAGFDNYITSGITPGQLGVLLAYPAIGKSWMSQYFAVQAWKHGRTPLIISLEMTEEEVRNRLFTIIGEGFWSHKNLSSGKVELDMFKKWAQKTFEGKPPFHIISSDGMGEVTPSVVRGKIEQYKPDIVFIDYINLMQSNQRSDSEPVKMKNISRELKLLAIGTHVPIMAISSATPDETSNMNTVPTLGQIRWGKDLAYDADFLLAMGRDANSDTISCVFRKNRNGFLGEFLVQVDFDSGRFRDIDLSGV